MATEFIIETARGIAANRPASGNPGQMYFATDTNAVTIWNETTSTWVPVGSGGGSGITLAQATALAIALG